MKTMRIGSGDVSSLLSGINTKAFKSLLQRFVSDEIPHWNAKSSPIDALRTGAILEERYQLTLSEAWYPQVKSTCKEMDVFRCSLDFAKLENNKIVDFEELKTISLNDFLELEIFRDDLESGIEYIKKKKKAYYNQVQEQLLCTGLNQATLVFLCVYSYDDDENYNRYIQDNEVIKFSVKRDEKVISQIKERGEIFQQIKNLFK